MIFVCINIIETSKTLLIFAMTRFPITSTMLRFHMGIEQFGRTKRWFTKRTRKHCYYHGTGHGFYSLYDFNILANIYLIFQTKMKTYYQKANNLQQRLHFCIGISVSWNFFNVIIGTTFNFTVYNLLNNGFNVRNGFVPFLICIRHVPSKSTDVHLPVDI